MLHGDYTIAEIDGTRAAEVLHYLNAQVPEFPPLSDRHLTRGYWWLARTANKTIVGFAGLVAMEPFPACGYLKRAYVSPAHRGKGLQLKFLRLREAKAREIGWTMLVAECAADNVDSAGNFIKAGFTTIDPEQAWGAPGSVYFSKRLGA